MIMMMMMMMLSYVVLSLAFNNTRVCHTADCHAPLQWCIHLARAPGACAPVPYPAGS